MSIHPVAFFILVLIFSLPLILIGGKRLYDLHGIVFKKEKQAPVNFYAFSQNHPILSPNVKRASPDLSNGQSPGESFNFKETLKKLYVLLFKAGYLEKREKELQTYNKTKR
ncbi:MAG: hypothetical protein N2654_03900 [Deltaproteobacteria bacterium]|nr:hypothetical protein [Deltaproteobacteria bacterium]